MDITELVELCKKGDERALGLLYKIYAAEMMKICTFYVTDKQIAQDLLHDSFILIFTSIKELKSPEKLENWMATIVRHLCIRYKKQCYTNSTIPLAEINEDEEPIDTESGNDFPPYALMLRLVETLPEGYGKVFKMSVLEGLSHKEIGALLNIAPHSSSSQLTRAKEMLRKLITQHWLLIGLIVFSLIVSVPFFHRLKENVTIEHPVTVQRVATDSVMQKDTLKADIFEVLPVQYAQTDEQGIIQTDTVPLDHIAEQKDSTRSIPQQMIIKQPSNDGKQNIYPKRSQPDHSKGWSLVLAYSLGDAQTDIQRSMMPGDISSAEPMEVVEMSRHHLPVVFSLSVQKQIGKLWGIETGIRYTGLRSDFETISDIRMETKQKIHYIGIPLKGTFSLWKKSRLSIYTTLGVALDIPVKAISEQYLIEDTQRVPCIMNDLRSSVQWSTNFGIGLQYRIAPHIGIFAEPNLNYYFDNGDNIQTIRTQKPLDVTFPIGIRISW